jgi:hypothetical protein
LNAHQQVKEIMQLDHVFCLVASERDAENAVAAFGLEETYRRQHSGQGTSNICCCFDNAFVEFLWISNVAEARSQQTHRLGLFERSQYRIGKNCPFGISWRGSYDETEMSFWFYEPSYLPKGMRIPIATASDDNRLPLVFQSPGINAPREWPREKQGNLQRKAGYSNISQAALYVPPQVVAHPLMVWLVKQKLLMVKASTNDNYSLTLEIHNAESQRIRQLRLPNNLDM